MNKKDELIEMGKRIKEICNYFYNKGSLNPKSNKTGAMKYCGLMFDVDYRSLSSCCNGYQYPQSGFLSSLHKEGVNINYIFSGKGDMLINSIVEPEKFNPITLKIGDFEYNICNIPDRFTPNLLNHGGLFYLKGKKNV